jgi:hypothetical protein
VFDHFFFALFHIISDVTRGSRVTFRRFVVYVRVSCVCWWFICILYKRVFYQATNKQKKRYRPSFRYGRYINCSLLVKQRIMTVLFIIFFFLQFHFPPFMCGLCQIGYIVADCVVWNMSATDFNRFIWLNREYLKPIQNVCPPSP